MNINKTLLISVTAFVLSVSGNLIARGNGGNWGNQASMAPTTEESTVSTEAVAGTLAFLREEEKVARDVYRVFAGQWELAIFNNITRSEQKHMDAIGNKLLQYGIQDPVIDDTTGEFSNPELKQLYQDLINRGLVSAQESLQVAAFIEEIDIRDLQQAINQTNQSDLIQVYENLMRASRNHLRAFVRQIESQGTAYTAQVLPATEVDAILNSGMERGGGMGRGQGHGQGRGQGRGMGRGMGYGRS